MANRLAGNLRERRKGEAIVVTLRPWARAEDKCDLQPGWNRQHAFGVGMGPKFPCPLTGCSLPFRYIFSLHTIPNTCPSPLPLSNSPRPLEGKYLLPPCPTHCSHILMHATATLTLGIMSIVSMKMTTVAIAAMASHAC